MRKRKKQLIESNRKISTLKKELRSLPKDDPRSLEIRKELGIATMRDMLGDKYPIRICRHCGKRAYSKNSLWEFHPNTKSKYGYDNCCMDCHKLLNSNPSINIVGSYCMLKQTKTCPSCGRQDSVSHIGIRSWFTYRAKICKYCLGSHDDILGFPIRKTRLVSITYEDVVYNNIAELARALRLPYHITRSLVIRNKLKEFNE